MSAYCSLSIDGARAQQIEHFDRRYLAIERASKATHFLRRHRVAGIAGLQQQIAKSGSAIVAIQFTARMRSVIGVDRAARQRDASCHY